MCGGESFEFSLQFYAPKTFRSTECFTEGLLGFAGGNGNVMMTVIDTVSPYDYEERLFNRLRFPEGQPTSIVETPVHLFASEELRDLIPIFSLTVGWQWQAYLHMPASRSILLNWEGEIFDFWTDEQSVFSGVAGMLETFGLRETAGVQLGAAPNGGPAAPLGNSEVGEGPPSSS
jgi:hypothetical protein